MEENREIQEFINMCHLIHEKGFVSGSGGNVSMKIGDRIVITPTGRPLGFIKAEELVWVEPDGSYTNGKPSKEVHMHIACYKARPDITAVVHVHSYYAVAIGCLPDANTEDAIPHYTPGYVARVGKLPILPYMTPGSAALADEVGKVIAHRNSLLLANHGPVTCGRNLEEAFDIMEEIEKAANLHFLVRPHGRVLTAEQEAEL